MKDSILCRSEDYTGIHTWYQVFTTHAHEHGFYVHPYLCFRRDHGGAWGFTFGDDIADEADLPTCLEVSCE